MIKTTVYIMINQCLPGLHKYGLLAWSLDTEPRRTSKGFLTSGLCLSSHITNSIK